MNVVKWKNDMAAIPYLFYSLASFFPYHFSSYSIHIILGKIPEKNMTHHPIFFSPFLSFLFTLIYIYGCSIMFLFLILFWKYVHKPINEQSAPMINTIHIEVFDCVWSLHYYIWDIFMCLFASSNGNLTLSDGKRGSWSWSQKVYSNNDGGIIA